MEAAERAVEGVEGVGPGSASTAMGHRRRRRGAWGRPQRVPVKSLNYKEKIEMREMPQNPDLRGNLLCKVVFYQKTKMIPGSIRTFW